MKTLDLYYYIFLWLNLTMNIQDKVIQIKKKTLKKIYKFCSLTTRKARMLVGLSLAARTQVHTKWASQEENNTLRPLPKWKICTRLFPDKLM